MHRRLIGRNIVWLLLAATSAWAIEPADFTLLTVVNRTGRSIVHLFASPRESRFWGVDTLLRPDRIDPGEARSFYLSRTGSGAFDLLAVDEAGDAFIVWDHLTGHGSVTRVELTAANRESGYDHPRYTALRVENRGETDIWYLFVHPDDVPSGGIEILGATMILERGETISITVPILAEAVRYAVIGIDSGGHRLRTSVSLTSWTTSGTIRLGAAEPQ